MATSDPPQRVNHAQSHGPNTRQQSAGSANQQGKPEAKRQHGGRQKQRRQQSVEGCANNGYCQHRQAQSDYSPDQRNHQRLSQHKKEHEAIRKSNRLQHRELAGSFADGNGHGVSGYQQQSEKDHSADGQDQELDVSQLFGKTCLKGGLGFRLGFRGRIRKSRVDCFGHAHGVVRVFQFQNVPPDRAFYRRRNIFVKVFPLQPELTLVAARVVIRVDGVQIELPSLGRTIESVFQWYAIANLPSKALRESGSDDCALPVAYKVLPLVVGNFHLRHDLTLILNVNDELREEVLFILINAAEP